MSSAGARHLAESAIWLAAERVQQFYRRDLGTATFFEMTREKFSQDEWDRVCLFYMDLPSESVAA